MPKRLKYQLEQAELDAVRAAMKSPNAKEARRAQTLYALHLGKSPQEIADLHNITVTTVYNTVKRFRHAGIEGLRQRRKSGRPHKLSIDQCRQLTDVIEQDPRQLGYAFSIWTIRRLQTYLADVLDISVSESTLRDTLSRMNYVFRRPKKSLRHVQDPKAVAAFQALLPELKKGRKVEPTAYSLWIKPDLT